MTTAFATPNTRSAAHVSTPPERVTPCTVPLRVIEGGRSPMARRRRRAVVSHRLLAVAGLVAAVLVFNSLLSIGGPMSAGTSDVTGVRDRIAASTYTVRPGDTLWEIAQRTGADGDVRDVVAELAEVNGGDVVQVGQVLTIPADLRR